MADPKPLPRGAVLVAEVARDELAKLDTLRTWAEEPEHYWLMSQGADAPPGAPDDRRRQLVVLEGADRCLHLYTVVFTVNETSAGLMRHVSVSCDGCQREPSKVVTWALLRQLGFRSGPGDWLERLHPTAPNTVVILEPYLVQ